MEGLQLLSCPALQIEAVACIWCRVMAQREVTFGGSVSVCWGGCCPEREVDELIKTAPMRLISFFQNCKDKLF